MTLSMTSTITRSSLVSLMGTAAIKDTKFFLENVAIVNYDAQFGVISMFDDALAEGCLFDGMDFPTSDGKGSNNSLIRLYGASKVRSSLFSNTTRYKNKAGTDLVQETVKGGAIVMSSGSPVVDNCTFVGNKVAGSGAAIAVLGDCNGAKIRNNIFYGNTANYCDEQGTPSNTDVFVDPASTKPAIASTEIKNNLSTVGLPAMARDTHNIIPGFKNGELKDYSLRRTSKCTGRGIILEWMKADSKDLNGNMRIIGRMPDLGAYENNLPAPIKFTLW